VLVGDGSAAFLAHAFNSSRLLAFAERTFFQTPYQPADINVDARVPARMEVSAGGKTLFSARMGPKSAPSRREDATHEGSIYLPGGRKVFYARLSGAGERFSFDSTDSVIIDPHPDLAIFAHLSESGFQGKEWLVREGAVHARSRTYMRTGTNS
jgi:hypothetical protein